MPRKLRVSSLVRRTRTTPSLQMMPITVLRGRSTPPSACTQAGRAARTHCTAPRAGGAAGRARCCPPPSAHSRSGRRGRQARRWMWRGRTAQGAHERLRSWPCAADGTASQRSASAAQRASSAAAHPCSYAGHRAGACRSTAQPGAASTTQDAALQMRCPDGSKQCAITWRTPGSTGITQLMARCGGGLRTIRAISQSQRKAERLTLVVYYI
jgi:hypothetical protein